MLLVKNKVLDWGPKLFKFFFFYVWQQEEGVKEVIKKSWTTIIQTVNSLEDLKVNLKRLKSDLKQLSKGKVDKDKLRKHAILA